MVLRACFCQGVKVSDKTFAGQVINILGVAFDFGTGLIGIKKERRDDLWAQLESILSANELLRGVASNLRGKLLFFASHFKGRHGRACTCSSAFSPTPVLKRALQAWRRSHLFRWCVS